MTTANVIRNAADLSRYDQSLCDVFGEYRVIPRPMHGDKRMPKDYAVVILTDGTSLYLETFGQPQAVRDEKERTEFNGAYVHVVGVAHLRMPTLGQGPLAPSISNIRSIEKS